MEEPEGGYEELLGKELRRRKIKILRSLIGILLISGFAIYIYFFEPDFSHRWLVVIAALGYISIVGYLLIRKVAVYRSLTDDLILDEGTILKYNEDQQMEKIRIPLESVEKVHFNIKDLPHTFYVVYIKDGNKRAENFYKERIKDEDEFIEVINENNLVDKDPITFEELKEDIEGK